MMSTGDQAIVLTPAAEVAADIFVRHDSFGADRVEKMMTRRGPVTRGRDVIGELEFHIKPLSPTKALVDSKRICTSTLSRHLHPVNLAMVLAQTRALIEQALDRLTCFSAMRLWNCAHIKLNSRVWRACAAAGCARHDNMEGGSQAENLGDCFHFSFPFGGSAA